jgi:hypothetical protein
MGIKITLKNDLGSHNVYRPFPFFALYLGHIEDPMGFVT